MIHESNKKKIYIISIQPTEISHKLYCIYILKISPASIQSKQTKNRIPEIIFASPLLDRVLMFQIGFKKFLELKI